jgi:hypothetical protein
MKNLLLLFCALFITNVFSQKNNAIKELTGTEFRPEKKDRPYFYQNAIKIGDNYYVVAQKGDKAYINFFGLSTKQKYDFKIFKLDAKMNVKSVATIPAEFEGKDVQTLKIGRFGDKLCALFYFNNRKTRKQYLFAQIYDLKNFTPVGKPYKIGETMITKKETRISSIFKVSITDDFSKMLITADRSNIIRSRREKKAAAEQKNHTFSYWLIDSDFKLINVGKNVKMGKGTTEIIDQTFDNEGNMCILGFEQASNGKKSRYVFGDIDNDEDGNNSKLVMKIIRPNGEASDLTFANGEYFYSAMMKLNPNTGNVAVVGLLGSGKYGAKGLFTQQVNIKTAEVLAENKSLFGVDLVKEINSLKPPTVKSSKSNAKKEKRANKEKKESKKVKKTEVPDYLHMYVRLGSCHYNDSNELVVVGQKYYTYTVTYTTTDSKGRTTTHTVTYYVYGDIISFKISPEGEIENFGYIFHHVETTAYVYKDYTSLYTGDKLYILTKSSGGQMFLNNKTSSLQLFKEYNTIARRNSYANFMNVSENEMIHISSRKNKVIFSLISVKLEK